MESDEHEPEPQPEPEAQQQNHDLHATLTQTPAAAPTVQAPTGYVNAAHGTVNFWQITTAAAPATDLNALTGGMPSAFFDSMKSTIVGMVQAAMTEAIQLRPTQAAAETARADIRNQDYKALQERASLVHWELLTVSRIRSIVTIFQHYYNYILDRVPEFVCKYVLSRYLLRLFNS